jgi:phosphoribosylglycinamide formyltransferase-1
MRLAVLASGNGSNLQAILDACGAGELDATVVAVVSDRPEAYALVRASNSGVSLVAAHPRGPQAAFDRRAWDASLAEIVSSSSPDWVVLAGFMRVLTSAFLDRFPGRVINLHPARPGELAGTNAIARAFDEFRAGTRTSTGVMVHLVPDEEVDEGPVLAVEDVPILASDTLDTLAARMHTVEHRLLIRTLTHLPREVHS